MNTKDKLMEKIEEIIYEVGYLDRDYRKSLNKATKKILTLLTSEVEKAEKKGYQKGYWNRKADDKEAKEMNEADEAHRTEEGYCCACGYDMAVMEDKIKKERERLLKEVEEKVIGMILKEKGEEVLTDEGKGFNKALNRVNKALSDIGGGK